MKRVWILAGETVHIEGFPFRVAEDAAVDGNPHNLKLLDHVRFRDTPPKSASPEVVPKFALDSQIEITNQERASKEHAEGVIRALLKDRDRIIEQCATVCDEHARTNAKLPYHQAAAKFLARRIRELSASSPQNARGGGGGSSN